MAREDTTQRRSEPVADPIDWCAELAQHGAQQIVDIRRDLVPVPLLLTLDVLEHLVECHVLAHEIHLLAAQRIGQLSQLLLGLLLLGHIAGDGKNAHFARNLEHLGGDHAGPHLAAPGDDVDGELAHALVRPQLFDELAPAICVAPDADIERPLADDLVARVA